jgi:lipopolysaccharide/colanic/teichoic acid biosynthesis glycosyltransferase
VLLVVLSPLLLVLGLGVRIDSPGPSLFIKPRVGRFGREFQMLKFRSMCVNAEERLPALSHLNRGGVHLIRIQNDPRVTRFGVFLRRTSLDELPQLVNVLKGDMSFVGPRPQSPKEVAFYSPTERRRLDVPPGMTGLWQITARDDPSFERWVKLDLEYIERWNLALDLKILIQTPAVVLRTINRSTAELN